MTRATTLGERFREAAGRFGERTAVLDGATGVQRTYRELGQRCEAFARALAPRLDDSPRVGVLLPPGEAGVLANVALALLGRASVNLNYTLGREALAETARLAGLTRVISARAFLDATGLAPPLEASGLILVEDLLGSGAVERGPRGAGGAGSAGAPSDAATATVLFSSGTTAQPKGIVLSHANILANVDGVTRAFRFGPEDRLLGVLPFFHSFGYTVTLWTPLLCGASVLYQPNPLDAKAVGRLSREHRPTVALATPAFFQTWLRRCAPEDFASLRAAVVGAQKLPRTLAHAWRERFGTELLEGYGCTELSPVVSVNRPGENRPGTIGRPIPAVEVEVRDPDVGRPLPRGAEGLIWVRGPSVMQGYLERPEETRAVLREGWYDTGDIGRLDEAGHLVITDRLARFSKIGGEMVPHGRVEAALEEALVRLGRDSVELAVTALEDERKGERLVVVHTPLGVALEELRGELSRSDLPKLFLPRPDAFVEVAALPRLATGKLDLRRLRELARG